MLERVIGGGQTGADQAGWRAARTASIPTGGWMPAGFRTEDGPRPEFAELYGARAMPTASYPARTRENARWADVTLWFGNPDSRGGKLTLKEAVGAGRPAYIIDPAAPRYNIRPEQLATWFRDPNPGWRVVNIAGNRESKSPGSGKWVEEYLTEVFRLVRRGREAEAMTRAHMEGEEGVL